MIFSKQFNSSVFIERRQQLAQLLDNNSNCLILSNNTQYKNNDCDYIFRQDSNFWYLTGFNEPNSALLITKSNAGEVQEYIFCQERDISAEQWTGERAGLKRLQDWSGIENIYKFDYLIEIISKYLQGNSLYTTLTNQVYYYLQAEILRTAHDKRITNIQDINQLTGKLRLYKSQDEIKVMQESSRINCQAHQYVATKIANQEYQYEYQIQADIQYIWQQNNAQQAYNTIIGHGKNATILHYVHNNQPIDYKTQNNCILIDAGCELEYYASDITRTYNIPNDLYTLVNNTKNQCIELLTKQPSQLTLHDINEYAAKLLTQGLIDLGFIRHCSLDEAISTKLYRKFYMHGIGHSLGLDTHDIGLQRNITELTAGIVLTIEPGIYISEYIQNTHNINIPDEFRNIGIRLEDDIVLTDTGIINMTMI